MRARTFRSAGGDAVAVLDSDERHEACCFADEVGIDFPSMRAVIDRIRRPFVAEERPSVVGTVLRISRRDARDGATLPLDVPIRITCPDCGGRGGSWAEACVCCGGSGSLLRRRHFQVTLPAGVSDGTRLYFTVSPRHHLPTPIELHVVVHGRP
jgi:hypothetical protein